MKYNFNSKKIIFKSNVAMIKNTILVIKDQMPLRRFLRNFFVTGNAWGIFFRSSHHSSVSGKPKVKYNTKPTSLKAAEKMTEKTGNNFASYKCLWCNGYHIGKTRK